MLKSVKRARSEIKKAHKEVSGYPPIPFTDEEREMLTRENLALQETLALFREVIQPDSDVDVDRTLAQIEERRQWGIIVWFAVTRGATTTIAVAPTRQHRQ